MSDSDLPLARALLDGLVKQDKRGRLRQQYLRADSPNEADARLALARLLRSDGELDRQLRESLAELFDPKPPTRQQRKLAFVFRRRGKRTDHFANAHIFVEVHDAVKSGSKVAAAIVDIAEKYLSRKNWSKGSICNTAASSICNTARILQARGRVGDRWSLK